MRPRCPGRPTAALLAVGLALASPAAVPAAVADGAAARRAATVATELGGRSTIVVGNLDGVAADLSIDVFSPGGFKIGPTRVVRDAAPLVPVRLPLGSFDALGRGRYAATVFGWRSTAAVVATDLAGGGALWREPADEGFELALPYDVPAGEVGLLHVQNALSGALLEVAMTHRDARGAVIEARTLTVGPNASAELALDGAGPHGGWWTLSSVRPFGAHLTVLGDTTGRRAYDVGAVRTDAAAARLYAPLVARAAPIDGAPEGQRQPSRLVLVNPDPTAALVRPSYVGTSGPCAGFRLTGAPLSVAAGGQAVVDLAAEAALPAGCRAAAVLTAIQGRLLGVAMVATDSGDGGGARVTAAHRLPADADFGTRAWVPRLLRGAGGRRTVVVVQSAAGAAIDATLGVRDASGAPIDCPRCVATLAPGAAAVFDATALLGPSAADGDWAEVVAGGPVVVAFGEASDGGDDAWALAPRNGAAAGDAPVRHLLPHLLRDGGSAPTTTPTATPTRAPVPTPTAGGGRVTLYAVAVVNVTGNDDPACPACDGRYDDADRAAAARSPLPPLAFAVRTAGGTEPLRQTSLAIDRLQIAAFTLPSLPPPGATLSLEALPDGWLGCPNAPLTRSLDDLDFSLGVAKVDFHLSNTCLPANRPPLAPVAIPSAPAPTATAAPERRPVLLPAILKSRTLGALAPRDAPRVARAGGLVARGARP